MTTTNTFSFVDIPALRRECWIRSYCYRNKSTEDATWAKGWMSFGVLVGALTPAYALMMRSTGATNGVSTLLTGALATAGIASYSTYYKWQSKRYMQLSHKWNELYRSATEAEPLVKKDPKILEPIIQKKKEVEAENNEISDANVVHSSIKDYLKIMEPNNELFKHWTKDKFF